MGSLAGVLAIIPVLGPIISAIPVGIAGFSTGLWQGVGSLIAVIIIQQIENVVLVPMVMKRAVGLNPVITLLALLIGHELFHIEGAILAVPVAGIVTLLVNELLADHGIMVKNGLNNGDKFKKSKLSK